MLTIFADTVNATEEVFKFQAVAKLSTKKVLCFGQDCPYLLIERARQMKTKDYLKVLQTAYCYLETQPKWENHQLTMIEVCNNQKDLPLKLTVQSYQTSGEHLTYGTCETTMQELMEMNEKILFLNNAKGRKTKQYIKFDQFKID